MSERARYPRGHTFSPSTLRTIRQCKLRHQFKKVKRLDDPPGPQARVGSLVHRVLEVVALLRLEHEAGTDPLPPTADAEELLSVLRDEIDGQGAWVVKAAREALETAAPFSLENIHSAEGIIDKFPIAEGITIGGIVDRVDMWGDDDGADHACITDYKTGFIPPREELEESEQTTCYLAWAAEEFGIYDENLVLVYYWPGEDIRIAIRYDAETVQLGIDNMIRDWERWAAGKWNKTAEAERQFPDRPPAPATLGVHCSHCPFRDQCEPYQEHIRKPARVHPWTGMPMPELVELRHQIAGDAKMLETARKELDQHIMAELKKAKDDRWEDDDFTIKVQRDRLTNYTMGAVEALATATGLELEDVMRQVCSISTPKVRAFVGVHGERCPRVKRVADVYATPSMKSPYVRCRTRGGLF